MTNKKGISTVEIIVSFTIFVTFVIFIFIYINPLKQDISSTLLLSLETGLKNQAMTELKEWPFAKPAESSGCFFLAIPFESKENISVKDLNFNNINYKLSGNNIEIENKAGNKLYTLIQSDEISSSSSNLISCIPLSTYSWSIERMNKIYSYKKLSRINETYYSNYTLLKEQLDFSITSDFAVMIESSLINFTMSRTPPSGVQIKARKYPIEILKNDEKIKASITLLVW